MSYRTGAESVGWRFIRTKDMPVKLSPKVIAAAFAISVLGSGIAFAAENMCACCKDMKDGKSCCDEMKKDGEKPAAPSSEPTPEHKH